MAIKTSTSLLAILAVTAIPAFAQDATAPAADTPAETAAPLEDAAQNLENQAQDAVDEADAAVNEATDAVNEAVEGTSANDAAEDPEVTPTADDEAAADEAAATADEADAAAEPAETGADEPAADEPASTDAPDAAATDEPAAGEDAAAAEDDAATEGEAPASDATPSEQAAEEEGDDPKVGSYYVKSTHTDWTIRCVRTESNSDPCELYQLLKDGEGNSVAEMTLIPLANGEVAAGATMVVPLETDLTKGLSLAIDNGKANAYPFSFCAPVGCVSRMGFTSGELNALRAGSKAKVALLPFGADPAKPVELEMSLAGFTAGFDSLSKLAKETANTLNDQPAEEAQPAE